VESGQDKQGQAAMLEAMVMQMALSACSTMFGSLGVFCTYFSFLHPALGIHAVVFLGTAMAIVWARQPA
jgi:hypothetical protein